MTSVVDAELTLLRRRRMLMLGVGTAAAFALITTLATFLSAKPAAISPSGRGPTLEGLSAAGGATEAFRIGTGFLGVFVIVTFAARMTMEFSHGTMRTLLVHEPRRWRVVTGKTLALVIYSAGILAVAAGLTAVISVALAPGQDVSTAHWFGLDGAQAAVGDYLSAAAGLLGWAILGTLLGLVFRSVPVVVAVAVAWAGPFEHLLGQAWSTAIRYFPGLQAEATAAGGTIDVSYQHALALTLFYSAVATAAGLLIAARRDITA